MVIIHNKNQGVDEEGREGGVRVLGGGLKETQRGKQTGKTTEAPVLCYPFSCGDITVHFPRRTEQREGGGGGGGQKNRKVEKWILLYGATSVVFFTSWGILQRREF